MGVTLMPILHDPLLPVPVPVLLFDDTVPGQTARALCAVASVPIRQGALRGAQQQALLADLHALLATQGALPPTAATLGSGASLSAGGVVALAH